VTKLGAKRKYDFSIVLVYMRNVLKIPVCTCFGNLVLAIFFLLSDNRGTGS